MLVLQPAVKRRPRSERARIGLAIAGGGPIGGMYELGALRALDEAILGLDLTRLDVYVGVSSGSFLAAGLANGIDTTEMCRIFLTEEGSGVRFRPETFLRPAFGEFARRAAELPSILFRVALDWVRNPFDAQLSESLGRFGALIPTGLFDNEAIERFLREVFATHGRSNDFRELERKLYVVAVALDSGETVRFGAPGHDQVPISRAVQASSALPGLYPPVRIGGRYMVDGALRRTLHASVAMDEGMDLVLGLNPLVPFDAALAASHGRRVPDSLVQAGLPTVLSQMFRTILKSRMQVGLDKYQQQYPATDLVLFEPNADDAEMFFTNIFSFESRFRMTEHAYRATLDDLRVRRQDLAPLFARCGLELDETVIGDRSRTLAQSLSRRPPTSPPTVRLRHALADLEEALERRAPPSRRRRATRAHKR